MTDVNDPNDTISELLDLNERLLHAIAAGDWSTYDELCDPTLSAFEPEACGHLVEGMDFHRFYFDLEGAIKNTASPHNTTMSMPHVRLLGNDVAVISCQRLVQRLDAAGAPITARSEETRVWQRQDGRWQHVHFHRSANA
jgi:calcium/calmodulin-dependent protein kinase (CaM kinase) II